MNRATVYAAIVIVALSGAAAPLTAQSQEGAAGPFAAPPVRPVAPGTLRLQYDPRRPPYVSHARGAARQARSE